MQKKPIAVNLGNQLKAAREEQKLTQTDVAEKANVNANYYARVERGEATPRIDVMISIARALHIDLNKLSIEKEK